MMISKSTDNIHEGELGRVSSFYRLMINDRYQKLTTEYADIIEKYNLEVVEPTEENPYIFSMGKDTKRPFRWKQDGKDIKAKTDEELLQKLRKYDSELQPHSNMTFGQAFRCWLEKDYVVEHTAKKTRSEYRVNFDKAFKGTTLEATPIKQVSSPMIQTVLYDRVKERIKKKRLGDLITALKGFLTDMYCSEVTTTNLFDRVNWTLIRKNCLPDCKDEEARTYYQNDYDALNAAIIRALDKDPVDMRAWAVCLEQYIGVRPEELAAFKVDDVNFHDGYIRVRGRQLEEKAPIRRWYSQTTKNGYERYIPFALNNNIKLTLEQLFEIRNQYNINSEWLFPNLRKTASKCTTGEDVDFTTKQQLQDFLRQRKLKCIYGMRETLDSYLRHYTSYTDRERSLIMGHTEQVDESNYNNSTGKIKANMDLVKRQAA